MPSNPRVRQVMAELARDLSDHTIASLDALTLAICASIENVDFASITVTGPDGSLQTLAATAELGRTVDELQEQLNEGPWFDALIDDDVYVSEDLADDLRWPGYAEAAVELGVRAQMGLDLHSPGHGRAMLNLYSYRPARFLDAIEIAEIFAAHASMMLGYTAHIRHLETALGTRKLIGQALGIVMERYGIDEDVAFQFLARTSRDTNIKLRVVAADIVAGVNRRNVAQPEQRVPQDGQGAPDSEG
jgi:hypothetical protein